MTPWRRTLKRGDEKACDFRTPFFRDGQRLSLLKLRLLGLLRAPDLSGPEGGV